jgi:hypothetical protein
LQRCLAVVAAFVAVWCREAVSNSGKRVVPSLSCLSRSAMGRVVRQAEMEVALQQVREVARLREKPLPLRCQHLVHTTR